MGPAPCREGAEKPVNMVRWPGLAGRARLCGSAERGAHVRGDVAEGYCGDAAVGGDGGGGRGTDTVMKLQSICGGKCCMRNPAAYRREGEICDGGAAPVGSGRSRRGPAASLGVAVSTGLSGLWDAAAGCLAWRLNCAWITIWLSWRLVGAVRRCSLPRRPCGIVKVFLQRDGRALVKRAFLEERGHVAHG